MNNNKCKINKCIALDKYNSYCKYYQCNINELNDYEKEECNFGQIFIEELIEEYYQYN